MNPEFGSELRKLSDRELLEQVQRLARNECGATARLMAHLAEMEARKLHLAQGCSSLYIYCTEILHFSEYEASLRQQVARACRRFPFILGMLARGETRFISRM